MKMDKAKFNIYLAKSKLSISELAKTANISTATVHRGMRKDIKPKYIGLIADALGANVEDLIIHEED